MRECGLPLSGAQGKKSFKGQMDRDWKGKGTVPSLAGQLKVIFWGPKGFQWGGMIKC